MNESVSGDELVSLVFAAGTALPSDGSDFSRRMS
jgi:hypothetical protein